MLYALVRKSGRTFADVAKLTVYLNRVCGYLKGRKKTQRTTAAHRARIINLWKSKNVVTGS